MLSATFGLDGRYGNRNFSAHCVDEESSGCNAQFQWRRWRRPFYQFFIKQRRDRPSEVGHPCRKDKIAICGAGIADERRKCRIFAFGENFVLCSGRSSLYFWMGTWLPTGIPADSPYYQRNRKGSVDCVDRNSDTKGAAWYPEKSGNGRCSSFQIVVQPSEPLLWGTREDR